MQNLLGWMVTGPLGDVAVAVQSVLNQVFNATIDFLYTVVSIIINFFTQPTVLWTLAGLTVIYGAYRLFKRKSTSM